jgi:hypothetical protein
MTLKSLLKTISYYIPLGFLQKGAFVPPCPGDEYVLDENTGLWELPS